MGTGATQGSVVAGGNGQWLRSQSIDIMVKMLMLIVQEIYI